MTATRKIIRALAVASLCALAACATEKVQTACADAERILQVAAPFLSVAPPSVQLAATMLGAGSHACGSAEYAAAREMVLAFLKQRGVKVS